MTFDRITSNPDIANGKACIRGMRITVSLVLNLIENGMTKEEILKEYPSLEPEDIVQCQQYRAKISEKHSGKLQADDARKLQEHIKESRNEWDS